MVTVLRALMSVYRVNPVRPHCRQASGRHAWTYNLVMPFVGPIVGDECDMPKAP
jgi:hypothetical protein